MRKLFIFIRLHLLIALLCFSAFAQDFQTVRNGIEYARVTRQSKAADGKDENVVINLLRLDLTKVRLDVVHAMDSAIGLEKTSSIAERYGALAAINAGFFRIDKSIFEGDDVSLLMINRKLLSEGSNNRIALLISNGKVKTEVFFAHLEENYLINIDNGNSDFDVDGVNRQLGKDEIVLYTPEFHRTTLTGQGVVEIIVTKNKVVDVLKNGNSLIPSDGFVIAATGTRQVGLLNSFKLGAEIKLYYQRPFNMWDDEDGQKREEARLAPLAKISDEDFKKVENIVSGAPQLIKAGKINITWQEEKSSKEFVETHHPRTAVALLKDGKFLMATVDGRSEESGGMSLYQLADFLLEQGATAAMNLDGGGSSTMVLDGKIVNHPSDKEGERKVGDAILVFPR